MAYNLFNIARAVHKSIQCFLRMIFVLNIIIMVLSFFPLFGSLRINCRLTCEKLIFTLRRFVCKKQAIKKLNEASCLRGNLLLFQPALATFPFPFPFSLSLFRRAALFRWPFQVLYFCFVCRWCVSYWLPLFVCYCRSCEKWFGSLLLPLFFLLYLLS